MSRQLTVFIVVVYLVSTMPAFAGTIRDDFGNEQDFLEDKQLREGGVWGEDIGQYTWEDVAIKGTPKDQTWCWFLITGDYGWEDYTVECKVKLLGDQGGAGLAARRPCIDCTACYGFHLGLASGVVAISRGENVLDSFPFSPKVGNWCSLKAVVEGRHLKFYFDGELVAEAEDNTHPQGKAGVFVYRSTALFGISKANTNATMRIRSVSPSWQAAVLLWAVSC